MRNNNIIIVKCFISSFGGRRIHQFWGEQEPGSRGLRSVEQQLNSATNRAALVAHQGGVVMENPGR